MKLFNKIGDLSKMKNQFKLIEMLMKLGLARPNEITSVCATVICGIAAVHNLPEETFQEVLNDMLKKFKEVKEDEMTKQFVRNVYGDD